MKHLNIFEAFSNPNRFGVPTSFKYKPGANNQEIMAMHDQLKDRVYAVAFIEGDERKVQFEMSSENRSQGFNGDYINKMLKYGVVFLISGEGSIGYRYLISTEKGEVIDLEGYGKRSNIEDLTNSLNITKSELAEVLSDATSRKKNSMLKSADDFINSIG